MWRGEGKGTRCSARRGARQSKPPSPVPRRASHDRYQDASALNQGSSKQDLSLRGGACADVAIRNPRLLLPTLAIPAACLRRPHFFLHAKKKWGKEKPLKGTCSETVPLRIPPFGQRGNPRVPPLDSLSRGRETEDGGRGTGDGRRENGGRETGERETGERETGERETGDGRTVDGRTGDGRTGDGRTGDGRTGDGSYGLPRRFAPRNDKTWLLFLSIKRSSVTIPVIARPVRKLVVAIRNFRPNPRPSSPAGRLPLGLRSRGAGVNEAPVAGPLSQPPSAAASSPFRGACAAPDRAAARQLSAKLTDEGRPRSGRWRVSPGKRGCFVQRSAFSPYARKCRGNP